MTVTGTSNYTRTQFPDGGWAITVPPLHPCPECGDVKPPSASLYLCGGCGAVLDGTPPIDASSDQQAAPDEPGEGR